MGLLRGPKRRYYYFGLAPLAERGALWVGSSSTWRNLRYNTLAPGDLGQVVIQRVDPETTPVDKFLHYDHIGNVLSETTTAGAVSVTHAYDAYGRPVLSSAAGWAGNSLHITTKPYDAETGLFYFWQRWYDPKTGLFLSEAPMGRSAEHPYGFVENHPPLKVDPVGELCWWCGHILIPFGAVPAASQVYVPHSAVRFVARLTVPPPPPPPPPLLLVHTIHLYHVPLRVS